MYLPSPGTAVGHPGPRSPRPAGPLPPAPSRRPPPAGPPPVHPRYPWRTSSTAFETAPAGAPCHPSPVPVAGGTSRTPFRPPSHVPLVGLRRIRRRRRRRRSALQPPSGGIPGRQVRFSLLPRGSRRGLPPAPCRDVLRVLAPPSRREASLPPPRGTSRSFPTAPASVPLVYPGSTSRRCSVVPLRYNVPDPWRARDSVMITAPVPPRALPDAAGGPLRAPTAPATAPCTHLRTHLAPGTPRRSSGSPPRGPRAARRVAEASPRPGAGLVRPAPRPGRPGGPPAPPEGPRPNERPPRSAGGADTVPTPRPAPHPRPAGGRRSSWSSTSQPLTPGWSAQVEGPGLGRPARGSGRGRAGWDVGTAAAAQHDRVPTRGWDAGPRRHNRPSATLAPSQPPPCSSSGSVLLLLLSNRRVCLCYTRIQALKSLERAPRRPPLAPPQPSRHRGSPPGPGGPLEAPLGPLGITGLLGRRDHRCHRAGGAPQIPGAAGPDTTHGYQLGHQGHPRADWNWELSRPLAPGGR